MVMYLRRIQVVVVSLLGMIQADSILPNKLTCEDVNMASQGSYHMATHNNSCYLFVKEEKTITNGWQFCRDMGGFLTDLDQDTVSFFKRYGKSFNTTRYDMTLRGDFAIGLMYCPHVFSDWYWDTGSHVDYKSLNVDTELRKGVLRWSKHCTKMNLPNLSSLKSCYCIDKVPFVCKIAPRPIKANNTEVCTEVCQDVHTSFNPTMAKLNSTTLPPLTSPPTTTVAPVTTQSAQNSSGQPAVIACLVISLMANLVLGILIAHWKCGMFTTFNFKRKFRMEAPSDTVELHDVEQSSTNHQGSSHANGANSDKAPKGGTHEEGELYTSVDDAEEMRNANVNDDDDGGNLYQNQSSITCAIGSSAGEVLYEESPGLAPASSAAPTQTTQGQGGGEVYYSSFNQDRNKPTTTPTNVYGISSASKPLV